MLPDGFDYRPLFLRGPSADRLLQQLREKLDWQQWHIMLFGRRVAQPRLSAWYADAGLDYRYSGLRLPGAGWPALLQTVREQVQLFTRCSFNSVLLNAYRDGSDSMGWHADNEPELGDQPDIASVSVGATRKFLFRAGSGHRSQSLMLEHGSLLLMHGASQANWQHSVPKTRKPVGLRINLTFRNIFQE